MAHRQIRALPAGELSVLVIWAPVLGGNLTLAQQATRLLAGPGVTQFWDPEAAVGRWATEQLPWKQPTGPAWDVFYLYGREATWSDRPDPIVTWGSTIVEHGDRLATSLRSLLAGE